MVVFQILGALQTQTQSLVLEETVHSVQGFHKSSTSGRKFYLLFSKIYTYLIHILCLLNAYLFRWYNLMQCWKHKVLH